VDVLTDDAIAGDWRIWQRRRGHRYSLDDVATAWEATRDRPDARRCLDLGCGIGSVLLMVAWRLPEARLTGVEAQDESVDLARRNVERNGLEARVALVHRDLRDRALTDSLPDAPFDLVTGTPPYMPVGQGTPSPDPQRAHARMELRGGVEEYVAAAARLLAPDGTLVVCADARAPQRVLDAAAAAGLATLRRRDVIPRARAKGPLFTLWTLGLAQPPPGDILVAPPLVARDEHGARTDEAHGIRRFFGLPVDEGEAPSP